jgi:POT family proton-dependent oligopeptide transporter
VGTIFLLWNACLTCFVLTHRPCKGGWSWSIEDAMALYGTYTMSVYFTPVIGFLADRYLGYRWSVVLGALAMTLGRIDGSETPLFLYIELGFLLWEWFV